jgi:hypothetical protein
MFSGTLFLFDFTVRRMPHDLGVIRKRCFLFDLTSSLKRRKREVIMKNLKVLAIFALVAVMGLALAGCASLTLVSLEQDTIVGPARVGQGQDIDPKAITVWGNYEDGSRRVVSVSASNITFNKNATGTQTVVVKVSNQAASFKTEVVPLASLTLVSPPAKLEYYKGEALDLSGLKVNGNWNGLPAAELKVSTGDITGFNSNNLGSQRLTLTLNGKSVTFNVTVSQQPIAEMYRFTNGRWLDSTATQQGNVTVGAAAITTTTAGINLTSVYSSGGGNYTVESLTGTWAYLYNASGKIGFVMQGSDNSKLVYLGKTLCELYASIYSSIGVTVVTSDMQNVYNGMGTNQ